MQSKSSTTRKTSPIAWLNHPLWPWLIVTLACILRILHVLNSRESPTFWALAVDPLWYDEAAMRIANGDFGPFPLFRAPLYPMLLGLVYKIFGYDLFAARLLNVVLQGATTFLIYHVGKICFNRAVGIFAALLFAFNGLAIFYSAEILSASLEMFMAILCGWSLLSYISPPILGGAWGGRSSLPQSSSLRDPHSFSPKISNLGDSHSLSPQFSNLGGYKGGLLPIILTGLTFGLAAITRPNFLLLFPVALVCLLFSPLFKGGNKKGGLLFLFFALLPILPVTLANWYYGGERVLIATQGGVNFWIGNNPETTAVGSVLPGAGRMWTLNDAEYLAEVEAGHDLKPGELSSHYYRKGLDFLSEKPLRSVLFMIEKTALFFNRRELSNNKHIGYFAAYSPWLPPLIYLNFGVLLPLSLLGWFFYRSRAANTLLALNLVYALSVALFFIASRFRMPVVPWLSILAALGIFSFVSKKEDVSVRQKIIAATILIFAIIFAWMNPWHVKDAPVASARYMEGNAYLNLGNLDSAKVCFENAQSDPESAELASLNLGVIAYRRHDLESAKTIFTRIVDRNIENQKAWNNLGIVLEELQDTSGAMSAYSQAIAFSLPHESGDARHNLYALRSKIGLDALRANDFEKAVFNFAGAVDVLPSAQAYYHLSLALAYANQTELALEQLDKALAVDPVYDRAVKLKELLLTNPSAFQVNGAAPVSPDSIR